jgi:hypothetical protein
MGIGNKNFGKILGTNNNRPSNKAHDYQKTETVEKQQQQRHTKLTPTVNIDATRTNWMAPND